MIHEAIHVLPATRKGGYDNTLLCVFDDIARAANYQDMRHRLGGLGERIVLPPPLSLGTVCKAAGSKEADGAFFLAASVWFIRVGDRTSGKCNVTGEDLKWWGRKWYISPHMTDSEIVQTIFLACKVAMEHELREQFKFDDQSVFDPHHHLPSLADAMRSKRLTKAERTDLP